MTKQLGIIFIIFCMNVPAMNLKDPPMVGWSQVLQETGTQISTGSDPALKQQILALQNTIKQQQDALNVKDADLKSIKADYEIAINKIVKERENTAILLQLLAEKDKDLAKAKIQLMLMGVDRQSIAQANALSGVKISIDDNQK